jgi:GT2 family glycosyltransferase
MLERQYDKFRSGEWEIGPNNLYSGNFSVRREFLIRIGGFDEKFKRQEDVELGFRLAELGLRFEFDPEADGIHRPERTFESWYTTPYLYGVRDVQMSRDKGQEQAMLLARKHYRQRSLLTRILAKGIIGRPLIEPLLFRMLRPGIASLDRIGLRRAAIVLCSLTFNLRYLQGMAHEMGGARPMWSAIAGKAAPAG